MNIADPTSLDETQQRPLIDAEAQARELRSRAASVESAIAITRMEGGQPSAYCREQIALFEAGEISAAELRDRVIINARR